MESSNEEVGNGEFENIAIFLYTRCIFGKIRNGTNWLKMEMIFVYVDRDFRGDFIRKI